ncbi:MAG: VWA domain-containing protein, partial [Oscillospiraceae bacterium]|nr:VWA domain-containing protein [Oscillospiraceae bacterium]
MSNIEFAFEFPWLLLAVIPGIIAVLLPFFLLPKRRRKSLKKIFPMVLHLVIVVLLVLALAGFRIARISDEQAMLLLIDLSDSAANQQESIYEQANAIMDAAKESETPIGAVLFGGSNAYAVKLESLIKDIPVFPVNADASNLSSAMEYAASLLPSDKAKRLVLLTDGKETDGDADQTARYLATQGVRIDSIYFDTTDVDTDEVQISKFSAPSGVYLEDELTLSAEIQSNFEGDVTLRYFD